MEWTTPTYEEIKMDAEIGSYQADEERESDPVVGLRAGLPLTTRTSRERHRASDVIVVATDWTTPS